MEIGNRVLSVCFPAIIAKTIDETDNNVAVRKIKLYAPVTGNDAVAFDPFILTISCCDCRSIPAIAGPIALPIILIKLVIPVEMPIDRAGVAIIIMFITPTAANDKPMLTIARSIDTNNCVECKAYIAKNPIVVMIVPAIIGVLEPILDIIKPDVGPNISKIIENGI